MAVRVEDAGFHLKDTIMWVYSTGFPKARDIGKDVPEFDGWKSHSIKPAYEPIIVAMKPNEGSYANNATKWGVAGLNIDECRVGDEEISTHNAPKGTFAGGELDRGSDTNSYKTHTGRFPANLIHDGSDEVLELFPHTKSSGGSFKKSDYKDNKDGVTNFKRGDFVGRNDSGSASRFFYCAKASKKEKNGGLEGFEDKDSLSTNMGKRCKKCGLYELSGNSESCGCEEPELIAPQNKNNHPTVKPLSLMEYLCTLTKTPTGGIVLDPFMGSGSTGCASVNTGRDFVGIEREPEYFEIAEARIQYYTDSETQDEQSSKLEEIIEF